MQEIICMMIIKHVLIGITFLCHLIAMFTKDNNPFVLECLFGLISHSLSVCVLEKMSAMYFVFMKCGCPVIMILGK